MTEIEVKEFDDPDETRLFAGNGQADALTFGGRTVLRGTFAPGWKWSANVRPLAGTELCEVAHFGYGLSGTMKVTMRSGSVTTLRAGQVAAIPPGHDAEVIGDEPCVFLDFGEVSEYAVPR